jgi:site-specific recombinase XerD
MDLAEYLARDHAPATVRIYCFEIEHYIRHMGERQAEQAGYAEVMAYVAHLRERYDNVSTIHRILQALKQYYYYLIEAGKRDSHPCRYVRLRDKRRGEIQVQDLLSARELELLLEREERYRLLADRNRMVMSLLVYQALRVQELVALRTTDIDLQAATVHIHGTAKTNERTLALEPRQIMLLHRYLNESRPALLSGNPSPLGEPSPPPSGELEGADVLVITMAGTPERGEGVHYLVSTFCPLLPTKRLTPTVIRQSVIARLLKEGRDLRIVQAFAGHKKPSTTEQYRTTQLEELKAAVDKYHPG